jgi:tetratricopeptide (TPR) repeat protein
MKIQSRQWLWFLCLGLLASFHARAAPPASASVTQLLDDSRKALNKGDYQTATALAQQAWQRARQHNGNPSRGEWEVLDQLTDIAYTSGDNGQSVRYAKQSLALAQALDNDTLLVTSYTAIGNALSENGQWQEAEEWLQRSTTGLRRLNRLYRRVTRIGKSGVECTVPTPVGQSANICRRSRSRCSTAATVHRYVIGRGKCLGCTGKCFGATRVQQRLGGRY